MVKAAIFMGDPRFVYGFTYEVGTCRAGGVSAVFALFGYDVPAFHLTKALCMARIDLVADHPSVSVRCASLELPMPVQQCSQDSVVL